MKLAIDAGHGMGNRKAGVYDPGAVAAGETEAGIVMDWAETLKFYCLQAGINVFMIRTGATDANPVGGRDEQAERANCSHYLSLHCNAAGAVAATGTETLYRDRTDMLWAAKVQKAALGALRLADRGLKPESSGQHSRLAVFDFDGPCALCELGFITNPMDRQVLLARSNRIEFAIAVVEALKGGQK
jgi:N-acetylmuramoyl-L-alanine amidase